MFKSFILPDAGELFIGEARLTLVAVSFTGSSRTSAAQLVVLQILNHTSAPQHRSSHFRQVNKCVTKITTVTSELGTKGSSTADQNLKLNSLCCQTKSRDSFGNLDWNFLSCLAGFHQQRQSDNHQILDTLQTLCATHLLDVSSRVEPRSAICENHRPALAFFFGIRDFAAHCVWLNAAVCCTLTSFQGGEGSYRGAS